MTHFTNARFFSFLPPIVAGPNEYGRRSQAFRDMAHTLGGRGFFDVWFHSQRGLVHALNRLMVHTEIIFGVQFTTMLMIQVPL
jgi:hypothetical protein